MLTLPLTFSETVLFPARVCKITRVDGTVLRIAEAETSLTVSGDTFTPLPGCDISAVRKTIGGQVPSLQIKFAHSNGGVLDTGELISGLYDGAEVRLYLVDRDNLGAGLGLLFLGTVQEQDVDTVGGGSFNIKGNSITSETFVQTYAPMCRTDLFSPLCGKVAAEFARTATVTSIIDRFNATVSITSPPADDYFANGVGVVQTGLRFEISGWAQSSQTITTYLPLCILFTVGYGLTLYPGCDKTLQTCASKFSNAINFQGEPHFLGARAASVAT